MMNPMKPNCLIIRTAGINCDRELAHAFMLAGANVTTVHLNTLIHEPHRIDEARLIGIPGGFSYGDDIAAGRIFANRLRHQLLEPLQRAVERGAAIIGICNGFQVLVKLGLLPDPQVAAQTTTLADNTSGRFIDRWVRLSAPDDSACIWTKGLGDLTLPIAHGEGRFVVRSDDVLQSLRANRQIAMTYAPDDNPNGSTADIAGICDPTGRVLGLMPHPERYVHATHHPSWTRLPAHERDAEPAGLRMFRNAVRHASEPATANA
jgi:phosphoribosylformylglycinamidine synthase